MKAQTNEEYVKKIQSGDKDALNYFFRLNDRLIWHIARKFLNSNLALEDLHSIAAVGMMKACNTYDCTKEVPFYNYACIIMRNEILMELRKENKHWRESVRLESTRFMDDEGNTMSVEECLECSEDEHPYNILRRRNIVSKFKSFVRSLSDRDKYIVKRRVLGDSQEDIAAVLGLTQSYVSRRLKKVLTPLKRKIS